MSNPCDPKFFPLFKQRTSVNLGDNVFFTCRIMDSERNEATQDEIENPVFTSDNAWWEYAVLLSNRDLQSPKYNTWEQHHFQSERHISINKFGNSRFGSTIEGREKLRNVHVIKWHYSEVI